MKIRLEHEPRARVEQSAGAGVQGSVAPGKGLQVTKDQGAGFNGQGPDFEGLGQGPRGRGKGLGSKGWGQGPRARGQFAKSPGAENQGPGVKGAKAERASNESHEVQGPEAGGWGAGVDRQGPGGRAKGVRTRARDRVA